MHTTSRRSTVIIGALVSGDQAFSFSETDPKYEPYETQLFVTRGHNLVAIEVDSASKSSGANVGTVAKNIATAVLTKINWRARWQY